MPESFALQYDEQGRAFYQLPGQKRTYVSPVAMGKKTPADTTGILRSRPQWNSKKGKWETPIDWGNIANLAVGTALTAGAGSAAFGGAPVAASSSPTLGGMYSAAPTIASQGASSAAATGGGGSGFLGGLWGGIKKAFGGGGGGNKNGGRGLSAREWLDLATFGSNTVGNIWGAKQSADAANRAAEIQAQSAREALALVREQWEKYNKDYEPFLKAGQGAIGRLSSEMSTRSAPAMPASVQRRLTGPGETYTPGGTHEPMTLGEFGQPRPVGSGQTPAAVANVPVLNKGPWTNPGSRIELPVSPSLPPGVPPGSVPVNGGINPNFWAYQTPDGRIISGTRDPNKNRLERIPGDAHMPPVSSTMPVERPPALGNFGQEPVSTTMPVGDRPQLVKMEIRPGMVKDVPAEFVPRWQARGATVVAA